MKDLNLIDLIQTEVIAIDQGMNIVEANKAFEQRHNHEQACQNVIGKKCYDSAYHFTEACGYKKSGSCPARRSFLSKQPESAIHHFWVDDHAVVEKIITTPIFDKKGNVEYVIEEFRDITQLLGLKKGIISICSYCRKVRDEDGTWLSIEAYIEKHTGAKFSHGICEDCNEALFSEFDQKHSCSH